MFKLLLAGLAIAGLAVTSVEAQTTASVTYYGTGCTHTGHTTPSISVPSLATLGGTLQIQYGGNNGGNDQFRTRPVLMLGFSTADLLLVNGPPIPGQTLDLQPSDCRLYVEPMVFTYMGLDPDWVGYFYFTTVSIPVPNNVVFMGAVLYGQWLAVNESPIMNRIDSVTFSPRANITVGN